MTKENYANHFNLDRFINAQDHIYPQVIKELKAGRKQRHWMWFIFPQIEGLGRSSIAQQYSIKSLEEAQAYLEHPVLGERLLECAAILTGIKDKSANDIFGFPDNLKLHSCITLFSMAAPGEPVFEKLLAMYFKNKMDTQTIDIVNR